MLPDWFSGWTYLTIFMFGVCIGLTLVLMLPAVHAQTPLAPTSGLKFLDQKAYIYTIPPLEVQQQQQTSNNSLTDMSVPLLVSAGGIIGAKIHSDRKTGQVAECSTTNNPS